MGIRVLELSHGVPGPQLAKIMGDFGADVIKVEAPNPSGGFKGGKTDTRGWNPLHNEVNRNKRGLAIDLKQPANVDKLKKLVAISDVVIGNFSAGVMSRFGLSYDILKNINPSIIMIELCGLGQEGPKKHYATWGPNLQPVMGLTNLWNHPGSKIPVGTQQPHPDYYAGTVGFLLVISAIRYRMSTGLGQYFDVAQVEAAAPFITPQYNEYYVNKKIPKPKGNTSQHMSPHNIYRCSGDDQWVSIAVRNDEDWQNLKKALGNPSWASSKSYSTTKERVKHVAEIDTALEQWTKKQSPSEIVKSLQEFGVPSGEVHAAPGLRDDEQLNHRGHWVPTDSPYLKPLVYSGEPINLSKAPFKLKMRAPIVGEHNDEIVGDLLGDEP